MKLFQIGLVSLKIADSSLYDHFKLFLLSLGRMWLSKKGSSSSNSAADVVIDIGI